MGWNDPGRKMPFGRVCRPLLLHEICGSSPVLTEEKQDSSR